ncbi:GSCFA domain-containing protein [Hymenobacter sp. BT175]|uniref:GSCFA domain-containing protein n=1 Tax=Hymenobacter translucens TaxID=2886507 RepID=UPI001D0E4D30|nr:GSCFA domain-containing protein [Hymenobacter translucens]MCC2547043.1 GSCFA domain-containing protein [Hymenobacter translucens]
MFRTELPLTPDPNQLPPGARVLTIGSCFSDVMGARLADYKVPTLVNPFGTVFNPLAAAKLLRAAAGEDMDWQQHLVEARGRWQSYDFHATIGADSPPELLTRIQTLVEQTGEFLRTANVVVLTLGTAYAYRLRETDEIVSNCHKVPAERFDRELLSAEDIVASLSETHARLRRLNPKLRLILTVSPVRHLKDTLPLNSVSKSVLRVACHYLSELLPDVSYFPAYELLMDDLRDYRFYGPDMLHPSEVAENYVWEKFTHTYFDQSFGRFKKEWRSLRQALTHRPLHPAAPEHAEFLAATLERLERLAGQADVQVEIAGIQAQIQALPAPKPAPVPELEDDEERIDIEERSETALHVTEAADDVEIPLASERAPAPAKHWRDAVKERLQQQQPAEAATPESSDDAEEGEEGSGPVGEQPTGGRKRKRRSRGGAKRNRGKKAALLAAQADGSAQATVPLPADALPAIDAEAAAPAQPASSGAVYSSADSERFFNESLATDFTPAPEPSPEPVQEQPLEQPAPAELPAPAPRKGRSRGGRKAPAVPTLPEATVVPEAAPEQPVPVAVPEAATEPDAVPVAEPQPAEPKGRPSRRKAPAAPAPAPTKPYGFGSMREPDADVADAPVTPKAPAPTPPAATPAPAAAEPVSVEPAPVAPAEAPAKPAPKPKASRPSRAKKKPEPAAPAPVPPAAEAAPAAPAKPAARKRPPRKKPAAGDQPS